MHYSPGDLNDIASYVNFLASAFVTARDAGLGNVCVERNVRAALPKDFYPQEVVLSQIGTLTQRVLTGNPEENSTQMSDLKSAAETLVTAGVSNPKVSPLLGILNRIPC